MFFDEVHESQRLVTLAKYLAVDGRLRLVMSGSLLGVELRDVRSFPVGYLQTIHMFPLDFEEFVWAQGAGGALVCRLSEHFVSGLPVDEGLHSQLDKENKRFELKASGAPLRYLRRNRVGVVDFLAESAAGPIVPIELKSGKGYKRLVALNNLLDSAEFDVPEAFVLSEANLHSAERGGKTVRYVPLSMVPFLCETLASAFRDAVSEACTLGLGADTTDRPQPIPSVNDATIIAKTALGIPDALHPIHDEDDTVQAARLHATSRDHHTATATRAKNRLRAILLESCPEFETLTDLTNRPRSGHLGTAGKSPPARNPVR